MSYRAGKSGLAADVQRKVDANYCPEEGAKCLNWIRQITGAGEIADRQEDIDAVPNAFYNTLKDGILLCKLIDAVYPGKINWNDKTFQTPKIDAMRIMRERERITMFTRLVQEFGVPETCSFPTESLHEKGVLNLAQVCGCIRALGIEAQTKENYFGAEGYWPKKSERNVRKFTEEQMRASQTVISLQYGTNLGANQSGLNFGKTRNIID